MADNPNDQDKKHRPPPKPSGDEKPAAAIINRIDLSAYYKRDEKKKTRK